MSVARVGFTGIGGGISIPQGRRPGLVRSLRRAIQNGRVECSVLFLAHSCNGPGMATPGGPPKICLYGQSLRTHHARQTVFKNQKLIKDFGYIADLLGPQMGCFLFQLPPSFHYTPARLKSIVTQLDPGRSNVVEFRHRSWWNENVYSAFRAARIIFCSCSGPRLPDELVKTADEIYIRFHGTKQWYRHDYSERTVLLGGAYPRQRRITRLGLLQ